MALDYRGFYASVENDYETLQMYDIDEEKNEISCWIESRVGERFEIAIRSDESNRKDALCEVFIDNSNVATAGLKPGESELLDGLLTNSKKKRPFVFTKIPYADISDEDLLRQTAMKLGEITIEIRLGKLSTALCKPPSKKMKRKTKANEAEPEENIDQTRRLLTVPPTNEESKITNFHTVSLGDDEIPGFDSDEEIELYKWILRRKKKRSVKPDVVFRFFYRPREVLVNLRKMPSFGSPKATVSPRIERRRRGEPIRADPANHAMAPVKVEEPEESALHEVLEEQNEHEQAEEVEEPMVSGPVPGSSSSDDTSPAVEHRRHAPVQVKIMKIDEAELQSIIAEREKLRSEYTKVEKMQAQLRRRCSAMDEEQEALQQQRAIVEMQQAENDELQKQQMDKITRIDELLKHSQYGVKRAVRDGEGGENGGVPSSSKRRRSKRTLAKARAIVLENGTIDLTAADDM